MQWFSKAVKGGAFRSAATRLLRNEDYEEMTASLLHDASSVDVQEIHNKIKTVRDEINTLCLNILTDDDFKNLTDSLTKINKSPTQQLKDLESFKENLQLIINKRTSFSAKDTLKIQNRRITFGDYVYNRLSHGNVTYEGWYKNKDFVYGKKIVKDGQGGCLSESGEFESLNLKTCMYSLKKGAVKIEKDGKVTEIQEGEFKFDKLLIIVKGEIRQFDTGVTLNGEFKSIDSKSCLCSGTIRQKNGPTKSGFFEYIHEIQKIVLCKGDIVDSDQTSTLDLQFISCKDKVLYFGGKMTTKHTQDGYVTTYEGLFRYELESREHILVQGKKTLQDGTIYDGEFYLNTNSNEVELLKGTIKYPGGQTVEVT